jgi:acetylornithine deacetylase
MQTLELLDRLVGFPTVSRDSNLDLIEFVSEFLKERSADVRLFKSLDGRKANLFATVGPRDRAGVMLSGHTDVVPVEGQRWSSNPFELTARAGAFYGRGTADMKGFIACALAAADRAAKLTLRSPLHLALSYDEEIGCVGVRSLIQEMKTWASRPSLCIVGEPTMMQVAIGHKGKTALKVVCTGQAAHSSLAPRAVNAIHLASDLIQRVREMQAAIETSGAREAGYDIGYSTIHVGRIRGGTALNVVPDLCELEVEIRNISRDDPARLVDQMRSFAAEIERDARRPDQPAGISIELTNEYPGLDTSDRSSVAGFVNALTDGQQNIRVAFGSEAGLFSGLGIPTVLCGPGSIAQAHRADEYVAEDQLLRCGAMMDRLLQELL